VLIVVEMVVVTAQPLTNPPRAVGRRGREDCGGCAWGYLALYRVREEGGRDRESWETSSLFPFFSFFRGRWRPPASRTFLFPGSSPDLDDSHVQTFRRRALG
jgi:hypothetical protein